MINIELSDAQLKVLADIGIAAGQLSSASMILPFVVPGIDRTAIPLIIIGASVTVGAWLFSAIIVRKVKS